MSTKTSFKRIAAVAAVALTLGGFSAVSAHAVTPNALVAFAAGDGVGVTPFTTGAGVAGPANTVTVNVGQLVSTTANGRIFVTISGASSTIASFNGTAQLAGTTSVTQAISSGSAVVADDVHGTPLVIKTPAAGTITVSAYKESATAGIFSSTADETVVITVNAAGLNNIYSASTIYGYSGDTTTVASITSTTDAAFSVSADSLANANVATFLVTQKDANAVALTTGATFKAISVYTNVGTLSTTAAASVSGSGTNYLVYTPTALENGAAVIRLHTNTQTGTATVVISIGGVEAKRYVVTFTGSTPASATLTAPYANVATSATASLVTTPAAYNVLVVAKDSNGNVIKVASPTLALTSSDTSIVSDGSLVGGVYNTTAGGYEYVVTGGATAGSATLTLKTGTTVLGTTTVNAVDSKIATIALSLDADTYAPGDKVTATLTAANAAGKSVADGSYYTANAAGLLTTTLAANTFYQNGATPFGTVTFTGGKATDSFYAPTASFKVSATTGTSAALASAAQGVALSASATVSNAAAESAQAAIDAAQEATDAANAAYDAANNAMDSADAATAAAQDASDNASAALAAVTSLSATVAKLVKSVTAIATALASIKKKLGVK